MNPVETATSDREFKAATPAIQPGRTVIRVEPPRGWRSVRLSELWEYRELIYFLAWRDVKARYKQTILGASWAIIQPFVTMVVFSLFFGRLARIPSDGLPYPIFAYCALVPWVFFANTLTQVSNSMVGNAALIRRIYFPRLVIPLASIASGLIDFVLALSVLIGMMAYYRIPPTINALFIPLLFLLAILTALGAGIWFSTLNVQYRDVRYVVPFLIQVWLVATPVAYPSSLLSGFWRTLYGLNPMVGVVEGFRWTLLGAATMPGPMMAFSALATIVVLVTGVLYLSRMERTFADVI